jgi:hemolysin D
MNERTTPPAPAKAEPQKPQVYVSPVRGRDREFLPAALEILETPPSPLPVASMLTICAVFAAALTWSWFGKLDVHAVAPGKIETAGRAKTIQPFDSGKVVAIHVANGQAVKAGEVLIELDPAEAAADADAARSARSESLAETARPPTKWTSPSASPSARSTRMRAASSGRRSPKRRPRPRRRSVSRTKCPPTSGCASDRC